jgi:hypothetical protein
MRMSNMTDQKIPASLHLRARIVGIVYLLSFVTAFVGQGFFQQVGINGSDAAAAANNLVAHETAFRAGIVFGLISLAFYIALTALLYQVFRPVSRTLSLLAAFFNGYLILRSTFLPRFLGVLPMLAGISGLLVLWPPLANSVALYIEALAGVAEGLLMLWLRVMGVNVQRWKEQADQANAAGASFLA